MHFPRFGVDDAESKHPVQHLGGDFGSEASIEVNNHLAITTRLVFEVVLASHVTAVVNLAVVEEANMRVCRDHHGLHPVNLVDDCQPLETKARARKGRNRLDTECIRTPMGHFHALNAQLLDVSLRTEYRPNATHG